MCEFVFMMPWNDDGEYFDDVDCDDCVGIGLDTSIDKSEMNASGMTFLCATWNFFDECFCIVYEFNKIT